MALLAATALAAGCSMFSSDEADCESVEEYQDAQVAPSVRVPGGLDVPDATGRLEVPEGPLPAEPLSRRAACLQQPPDYFDRPLTAPANPPPAAPAAPGKAGPPAD